MNTEILSVGTELLLGEIANTDAQMISEGLSELGINVYYHTVVGDNPQRLRDAVKIAKSRADIIITTGGLGPTYDDLTKEILAECFSKKMVLDQPSYDRLLAFFSKRGGVITENNFKQAYLPEGCEVLQNDWGTAPGCAFNADGVHVIMLPGPPRECRPMFHYRAVPYLMKFSDGVIFSHSVKNIRSRRVAHGVDAQPSDDHDDKSDDRALCKVGRMPRAHHREGQNRAGSRRNDKAGAFPGARDPGRRDLRRGCGVFGGAHCG